MDNVEKQRDLISVIVPIYNAQAYLQRCLDSILAQTYVNYEVICIDDGSGDNSGSICDRYANMDSRIRVYHIENKGVSAARNYALSLVRGEWFAFVDADDWIEPVFFEVLYRTAIENDCDIVACDFRRNRKYVLGYEECASKTVLFGTAEECICNYIGDNDSMQGMVWNKLYKTSTCGQERFDITLKINEDCLYTYDVMLKCKKACYISLPLYHWFRRADSASYSKKMDVDFTPANVFLELYKRILRYENNEIEQVLKKNYVLSVIKILLYSKNTSDNAEVIEARDRCKQWRDNIWNRLSFKEKIKYILAVEIYEALR